MQCSRCQHVNPAGAKFCAECAAPLARACAHCGQDLPPAAKFCPECGQPAVVPATPSPFGAPAAYTPRRLAEKIMTSRAAIEGERKQVTVLFADLKGSMELLSDRDPEEARRLLDPVLERMMRAVHHFEGTVSLVMGDGIMALFGAPLAHEDHAVRACYAALRMQERVQRYAEEARRTHGVNVQIRVGLNSGEVVVGAIGSDLHMDYTAVGRTTHLASRMEQLASPGSILLTRATLDLVEGYVAASPLGPVPVKGLAEPVEVFAVTGPGPARTRLQAAARRGLTRFTGRSAEQRQLQAAKRRARDGAAQVVAVVADAGMGKSRLVHEFTRGLTDWLVVACASVSYGAATSYLPVITLLQDYFDIHDRDDHRTIGDKVAGKVLALDRGLAPTLPALLALLDVPVSDPAWRGFALSQRRLETLDALRRLVLREASDRPVLLLFEDLHWIDAETQALLDGLVERLATERLILLVTYRPEYRHGWAGKAAYSELRLDALPAESTAALLDALLGDDPSLAPLKQRLVGNGNPFFLEETIRTLAETRVLSGSPGQYRLVQPVQAIRVPATVHGLLAARIDRLAPEDKHLLQTASVVGKDVPLALLRAVADLPTNVLRRGLDRLQAAAFLVETALFPDLQYAFKHALTHEVAYAGLLQERRRELHGRIVAAIETLHQDRLGEQTERLAHHALHGELREKAVDYLRQAGVKSAARSALPDARAWFEQALAVLATLPQDASTLAQACDMNLDLRQLLVQLGEVRRGFDCLKAAEALAEQLDDDRRRARVRAFATNLHALLGDLDAALAAGTGALEIATRLDDLRLRILTTSYLEQVHYHRGDYPRAIALAVNNLAALAPDWVYENAGSATPAFVFDRCWLVMSQAELGQFAEAARHQADMLRLAEQTHQATTIGQAHFAAGRLHLLRGEWTAARAHLERGVASCRTGSINLSLPRAVAALAWVLAQAGDTGAADDLLREGEDLFAHVAAQGSGGHLGLGYVSLGHAALLLGRTDAARTLAERAIEIAPAHAGSTAHALHLLGVIADQAGGTDAHGGEAYYRGALALAEPRGMRPLLAHCHFGLGRLRRAHARQPDAREHLATAAALYREMDMRWWQEPAEADLRPPS